MQLPQSDANEKAVALSRELATMLGLLGGDDSQHFLAGSGTEQVNTSWA
jgi:hypothetical protein